MSSEGFVPLADYGVIANGFTSALIDRGGSIDWCCMPRLDASSCFGRLLDRERGGHCHARPSSEWTSRRTYVDDSLVLATSFHCAEGEATVYDLLAAPAGDEEQRQLLRII